MGVDMALYTKDLETELEKLPKVYGAATSQMYATRRFNEILLHAEDEAKRFKDDFTGVEHIYIALLKERNTPSQAIFKRFNITVESFMAALTKVRANQRITSQNPEGTYDSLKRFGRDLVELAKQLAAKDGVRDRATFERGDVFTTDFSKATVIILFLTPEMNIRLRPKLLSLKPGSRVVANYFTIGDWNPDQIAVNVEHCERFCTARLWIVPAQVAGRWQMPQGELTLAQNYQTFSGTLRQAEGTFPVRGKLRGAEIFFGNQKSQYTGRVEGDVIDGIARSAGVDHKFRAKRLGP
jgi:hypothetical protein